MSFITSLGLLGLIASPATAFWRLPCKDTLVVERADPIINPGKVSGHVHQIMGGNGFNFQMNYNDTQASTCTSCTVHGDFSNYWTPVLYYKGQDGSFTKVNQVGGGLVYYLQRQGPHKDQLKAFPEGFQMVAGDPFKRSGGSDFPSQAVSYNCLNYNGPAKPETGGFPNYNCPDGLRSQLFFPSCWDGKNLDSSDHKSHMAYPIGAYNDGACPDTHPVHLVSIFFEIIWDTNKFADKWYGNDQPFVWSMGDPTGYGFHGDFINGWDVNILQRAVDECTNDSGRVEDCPVFQLWPDSTAEGCKIASQVNEDIQGPFGQLPGCNAVQYGPAEAQVLANCGGNITSTISPAKPFFQDLTGSGWAYQGCGTDNYYSRALTGATFSDKGMTNEKCVQFCDSKGFSIAGTEYADECYCANDIPSQAAPLAGIVGDCSMPCAGDSTNNCGGAQGLSLYKKCNGGSCVNVNVGGSASAQYPSQSSGSSSGGSNSGSGSGSGSGNSTPPPQQTSSSSSQGYSQPPPSPSQSSGSNNGGSSGSGGYSAPPSPPSSQPAPPSSTPSASAPQPNGCGDPPPPPPSSTPSSSQQSSSDSGSDDGSDDGSDGSSSTPGPAGNATVKPDSIKLPAGWAYSSCVTDTVRPRSLTKLAPYTMDNTLVTSTNCVAWCDAQGYKLAATEYGGECFCGNTLTGSTTADESLCSYACKGGDHSEVCGGKGVMNLYNKGTIVTGPAANTTYKRASSIKRNEHLHNHAVKARRFARGTLGTY